jgi:hypothetical protein
MAIKENHQCVLWYEHWQWRMDGKLSTRNSIKEGGYLICTMGWGVRVHTRLPNVLMFFLFLYHWQIPGVTIWNQRKMKSMYEHLNMISVSLRPSFKSASCFVVLSITSLVGLNRKKRKLSKYVCGSKVLGH